MTERSLLDQVGGRPALELVTADFYARVLADGSLAPFFRGVQMSRLQALQVDFFAHVLGGEDYRGRDMVTAHRGMKIQDVHFDAVATHLHAALVAAGVGAALVGRILGLVGTLREQIVERPVTAVG